MRREYNGFDNKENQNLIFSQTIFTWYYIYSHIFTSIFQPKNSKYIIFANVKKQSRKTPTIATQQPINIPFIPYQ